MLHAWLCWNTFISVYHSFLSCSAQKWIICLKEVILLEPMLPCWIYMLNSVQPCMLNHNSAGLVAISVILVIFNNLFLSIILTVDKLYMQSMYLANCLPRVICSQCDQSVLHWMLLVDARIGPNNKFRANVRMGPNSKFRANIEARDNRHIHCILAVYLRG